MHMKQDDKRFDAIHRVIKRGDLTKLKQELESGLDPNLMNRFDWTFLMLTALHGRTDMAELLIANGAVVSSENDFGNTAVSLAKLKGHKRTQEFIGQANECVF